MGSPPCQSRSGAAQGYDLNLNRTKELVHEAWSTARHWRSWPRGYCDEMLR